MGQKQIFLGGSEDLVPEDGTGRCEVEVMQCSVGTGKVWGKSTVLPVGLAIRKDFVAAAHVAHTYILLLQRSVLNVCLMRQCATHLNIKW